MLLFGDVIDSSWKTLSGISGQKLNFSWKENRKTFAELNVNEKRFFVCLFAGSIMKLVLLVSAIVWPAVLCNSASEKWSWPTSGKERTPADSRKDIYYENVDEKAGRIRVPTSYYDNRRWNIHRRLCLLRFRQSLGKFKSLILPPTCQSVFLCKSLLLLLLESDSNSSSQSTSKIFSRKMYSSGKAEHSQEPSKLNSFYRSLAKILVVRITRSSHLHQLLCILSLFERWKKKNDKKISTKITISSIFI